MRIEIVAGDSLGVRSMATYIETKDIKIFIDPGIALAPRRFGFPPHPIEIEIRDKLWNTLLKHVERSDVVIVTHYHYDHFNPVKDLETIYKGKDIFLKDYINNINPSQIRRSHRLLHRFEEMNIIDKIMIADSSKVEYGGTKIMFSKPFRHGLDDRLGYIIMVYINDGNESFLYTSDIEGPYDLDALDYIISLNPSTLYLDGPPIYLKNLIDEDLVIEAIANINSILIFTDNLYTLIIDHHFMRDRGYSLWRSKLLHDIDRELKIVSAAEYIGKGNNLLEAYRDELYKNFPVGDEDVI